jgi:glycosyltransferase involved in cell wall biosynthesis
MMDRRQKILFITQIAPFPITGGEQLRSYGLIKMLSNLGIDTTAVIDARSHNIPELTNIKFVLFDFRKLASAIHLVNVISIFRKNKALVSLINELTEKEKYDMAVIDYLFYGQYINFLKNKGIKVIYGTHNAQARLYLQRKATGIKTFLYIWFEYAVQALHERFFFPGADALMVVSEKDIGFYRRFIRPDRIFLVPNMIEKSGIDLDNIRKENHVIMTANFNAFQNAVGLEWFIREVWDEELSGVTRLKLFGYGSLKFFDTLKQKYTLRNIDAMGEVENIKPHIAGATLSIVPLLDGGGTRLKCLEAMSLKTQLISTSKGAEGIDHDHAIIIADTAAEFKQRILEVMDGRINTVQEAYRIYEEKYSLEATQKKLAGLLQKQLKQ